MKKDKITNKKIIEVYGKKMCNLSATAIALGVTRQSIFKWRIKDAELNEGMLEKEESVLDWAESKLIQTINDGDTTALIFFLKTKGKKRGYSEYKEIGIERIQVDVKEKETAEVLEEILHDDNDKDF